CISTFVSSTKSRRPSRGLAAGVVERAPVGPGSERLRCFKYFLRVARYFHLAPLAPQNASGIQQERAALDAEVLPTVERFFLEDIKLLAELLVFIREERKGYLFLLDEFVVGLHAVARDSDDLDARLAKSGV